MSNEKWSNLLYVSSLRDRVYSGVPAPCADFSSCKALQVWQEVQCSNLLPSIPLEER